MPTVTAATRATCIVLIFVFASLSHTHGTGADEPNPPPPAAAADKKPAATNRLADETSPYLLLHAHNPVDWYPWGEEALAKARKKRSRSFCRSAIRAVTGAT